MPPARLDLLVVALRELALDVSERVDGAALLERVRAEDARPGRNLGRLAATYEALLALSAQPPSSTGGGEQ